MAPSCPLSMNVGHHLHKWVAGTGDHSQEIKSGTVRSEWGWGVSFFSCVIFGRWTHQHILQENTSVLICVLIVRGTHPCAAHCAKGRVSGMNNGMEEEDQ